VLEDVSTTLTFRTEAKPSRPAVQGENAWHWLVGPKQRQVVRSC